MNREELLLELRQEPEMDPDKYDGSYELMREIVKAYSEMGNLDNCSFRDMNAIYMMAIGTFKANVEKKKEYINLGCLDDVHKEYLSQVLDRVWDKACRRGYQHRENDKPTIGMFGTGFYSFENKTTDYYVQSFIRMLVKIADMDDSDQIYDCAETVLTDDFSGMQAASASVVLHCLNPFVFPILNSNSIWGTIFEYLGLDLNKPKSIGTYIENCRRIKEYRDANFSFKNYRILDLAARKIDANQSETDQMNVSDSSDHEDVDVALNTILYGPPGTGKTYNTVVYAVSIIEKKSLVTVQNEAQNNYAEVKRRFDEYKKQGRVVFTTFHQSYGYEDFIEGIKPRMEDEEQSSNLQYSVEPGIFKEFCERAMVPIQKGADDYGFNRDPVVWKVSLAGTYDNPVRTECMNNDHIRIGFDSYGPDIESVLDSEYQEGGKSVLNAFVNRMRIGDIVFSCYTSRTIDAIGVITGDYEWEDSYDSYNRVRKVKWLVKGINEDIVDINGGSAMVLATVYKMKVTLPDVLNLLAKRHVGSARKLNSDYDDNYVFIIDEINRGNISKIFGELITLIEDKKRLGAEEELSVKLPYSKTLSFGVPKNVYILGTMNTADRSIAMMDTALRRRFSFVEMLPDASVLEQVTITEGGKNLKVADMLRLINKRIEFLYDREHTIGHAFFIPLRNDPSVKRLATIFKTSVVPLLQEYFYEDYSKIQLVLGDDGKRVKEMKQFQFIRDEEVKASDLFDNPPEMDLPERRYWIQDKAFYRIESYKMIGKGL